MIIHFTKNFQKKAAKLIAHNDQLRNKLKKQLHLFQGNPYHKGLRLHKLKGERTEQYAIWIEGNIRALAIKDSNVYIFFDLITHDQY